MSTETGFRKISISWIDEPFHKSTTDCIIRHSKRTKTTLYYIYNILALETFFVVFNIIVAV